MAYPIGNHNPKGTLSKTQWLPKFDSLCNGGVSASKSRKENQTGAKSHFHGYLRCSMLNWKFIYIYIYIYSWV